MINIEYLRRLHVEWWTSHKEEANTNGQVEKELYWQIYGGQHFYYAIINHYIVFLYLESITLENKRL